MMFEQPRSGRVGVGRLSISVALALSIAWQVGVPIFTGIVSYQRASASATAGIEDRIQETRIESARIYATKEELSAGTSELKAQMQDLQRSQNAVAHELGRLAGLIERLPRRR